MSWNWLDFIQYLEDNECELIDETDWAFHIYRNKHTNQTCGLNFSKTLDCCAVKNVCNYLGVEVPDDCKQTPDFIGMLKNNAIRGGQKH